MGRVMSAKYAMIGLLVAALAACAPMVRKHGYAPGDEELAQLAVGVDGRDAVYEMFGAPSVAGVLEGGDLYYVESYIRRYGIKKPEVIERTVLAISFDDQDRVANIERFTLADGKIVPISRRVTSSSVEGKSFLRQLLGNLGKFNADGFLQ